MGTFFLFVPRTHDPAARASKLTSIPLARFLARSPFLSRGVAFTAIEASHGSLGIPPGGSAASFWASAPNIPFTRFFKTSLTHVPPFYPRWLVRGSFLFYFLLAAFRREFSSVRYTRRVEGGLVGLIFNAPTPLQLGEG